MSGCLEDLGYSAAVYFAKNGPGEQVCSWMSTSKALPQLCLKVLDYLYIYNICNSVQIL